LIPFSKVKEVLLKEQEFGLLKLTP